MIQKPRLYGEKRPIVDDEIKAFMHRYMNLSIIPESKDRRSEMIFRWLEKKKENYNRLIKEKNDYPGQKSLTESIGALDILLQNGKGGSFLQLVVNNIGVLVGNLEEMRPIELFYHQYGDLYDKAYTFLETIVGDTEYLESDKVANEVLNQIRDYVKNPIDNPISTEIEELIVTLRSIHAVIISQKRQEVLSAAQQCMGSIHTKADCVPVDKKFVNRVDSYYAECKRRIQSCNNSSIRSLVAIEDEMIRYENECYGMLLKMS